MTAAGEEVAPGHLIVWRRNAAESLCRLRRGGSVGRGLGDLSVSRLSNVPGGLGSGEVVRPVGSRMAETVDEVVDFCNSVKGRLFRQSGRDAGGEGGGIRLVSEIFGLLCR